MKHKIRIVNESPVCLSIHKMTAGQIGKVVEEGRIYGHFVLCIGQGQ